MDNSQISWPFLQVKGNFRKWYFPTLNPMRYRPYFKVLNSDGQPLRFYKCRHSKNLKYVPDNIHYNAFTERERAIKFIKLTGMIFTIHTIVEFERDIGDPTNLTEIGF